MTKTTIDIMEDLAKEGYRLEISFDVNAFHIALMSGDRFRLIAIGDGPTIDYALDMIMEVM